jgi:hypothetical protein
LPPPLDELDGPEVAVVDVSDSLSSEHAAKPPANSNRPVAIRRTLDFKRLYPSLQS